MKKFNAKRVRITETPIQNGISKVMFLRSIAIGKQMAVRPRIPKTLKILEPTTLPIATSALPFSAPKKLTTSSGMLVPIPTIAAPITKSETL